jgi:cell fate regulator YaaT (PSP1 superfamily)
MPDSHPETPQSELSGSGSAGPVEYYYRIRFREQGQEFTVSAEVENLARRQLVMVKTDHGLEPAFIVGRAAGSTVPEMRRDVSFSVLRKASREEAEKYQRLPFLETDAYAVCARIVEELALPMSLVRVERFFNGSKIIFYFTAESRVDFRELVKRLVQEFRTRVEMRQIGVRHETQMIGGIGSCGRELCCSSFLKSFDSVSIKMAKAQDLPLNPAKISGVCNRLLCCLTYEYEAYKRMKKGMPRLGRLIRLEDQQYKVIRLVPLSGTVIGLAENGEERIFTEDEWRQAEVIIKANPKKQGGRKQDKS